MFGNHLHGVHMCNTVLDTLEVEINYVLCTKSSKNQMLPLQVMVKSKSQPGKTPFYYNS